MWVWVEHRSHLSITVIQFFSWIGGKVENGDTHTHTHVSITAAEDIVVCLGLHGMCVCVCVAAARSDRQ